MNPYDPASRLIPPRQGLADGLSLPRRKAEAEGGCGVIGMACSAPIPGRHLLQALVQMRNRGNGKGGGAALVGLDPAQFGVTPDILRDDYLLTIAYLDPSARAEVERQFVEPIFVVDHVHPLQITNYDFPIKPPDAVAYFVRVRPEALEAFTIEKGLAGLPRESVEDELVYQNTYRLNKAFYP